MKANYKTRNKRVFEKLTQEQQDAINAYALEIANEHAEKVINERMVLIREEMAKEYAQNIIPADRAKFIQWGIDLGVQQFIIELIQNYGFGVRKYAGHERLPNLIKSVSDDLCEGLAYHKHDIDMFRFAQNKLLRDYGLHYNIELDKREDLVDE
jgi:hypothetical protein